MTFTCYRRFRFLSAERTCDWLASAIEDARAKLGFALWAFVFMPEHVHIIVWPRHIDHEVVEILKAIKEPVGRRAVQYLGLHAPEWLPRITRRRGQRVERLFWQSGGGFDRNITEAKTLMSMVDYLHLNPVRRGLVEQASDWRWSSAAWYEGKTSCPLVPGLPPPLDALEVVILPKALPPELSEDTGPGPLLEVLVGGRDIASCCCDLADKDLGGLVRSHLIPNCSPSHTKPASN